MLYLSLLLKASLKELFGLIQLDQFLRRLVFQGFQHQAGLQPFIVRNDGHDVDAADDTDFDRLQDFWRQSELFNRRLLYFRVLQQRMQWDRIGTIPPGTGLYVN